MKKNYSLPFAVRFCRYRMVDGGRVKKFRTDGNLAASVRNFMRVGTEIRLRTYGNLRMWCVRQNVQPRRMAGSQLNPNDDVLLKSFFSVVVSPTVVDLLGVVLLLW